MKKAITLAAALFVGSCTVVGDMTREEMAFSGAGALAGGLVGYQFGGGYSQYIFAGIGALAGGLAGLTFSRNLDISDRWQFDSTAANTLDTSPNGYTNSWTNPATGHNGTFTPTRSYVGNQGNLCRELYMTINGKQGFELQKMHACMQPDGAWRFVQG